MQGVASDVPDPQEVGPNPPLAQVDVVSVAHSDVPAPVMAATAAGKALAVSGVGGADLSRILYASSFERTADLWSPAAYVGDQVGATCPALQIDQISNGGMAGLELAHGLLQRSSGPILISTGDRFHEPWVDRWQGDPGTVFGDGGTAMVVGTEPGLARVLSVHTESRHELEGMHRRGMEAEAGPLDLGGCKRDFMKEFGASSAVRALQAGQAAAVDRALELAGVTFADVSWFVLPHLGLRRLKAALIVPFGIEVDRTTWKWGRRVGHLGPGDQIYGLEQLWRSGDTEPGDIVLMIGIGSGFSWTCAVIQMAD
ncbi:hypothetical protein VV02_05860 [Luteipulveratus mongoliensis]|uniref:Beta-ketoacyl-[acyl-carrier-protein] synthase III C-terminal domain-containing protein n=1 Tax=Luteipulveratus mongoliensis TaxID=571913 RepID=A0A0K1JPN2_9MICO|nr:hypothetical protein VV02_05860 [Luteipulveratus mongoliensis]